MRALVFFLVLANLLFLVWQRGYLSDDALTGPRQIQHQQLMAERVNIVARDRRPEALAKVPDKPPVRENHEPDGRESQANQDGEDAPEKPSETAPETFGKLDAEKTGIEKSDKTDKPDKPEDPVKLTCLMLNDLGSEELARITELIHKRFRDFRVDRRSFAGSRSYWVFIPPLANQQEAERRNEALKRARVPESFIVQDPPAMRFAISLGVFSTRGAAEERLVDLRLKGIDAARVAERETRPASYQLELSGPETRASALRRAVEGALPKARMASCKARV